VMRADQRLPRNRNAERFIAELGIEGDVRVRIDEAGQHGRTGKIDDRGVGSRFDRRRRAYAHDFVTFDHDGLVGLYISSLYIKQSAGADHNPLHRCWGVPPRRRDAHKNASQNPAGNSVHALPWSAVIYGLTRQAQPSAGPTEDCGPHTLQCLPSQSTIMPGTYPPGPSLETYCSNESSSCVKSSIRACRMWRIERMPRSRPASSTTGKWR